jgi:hypothetical protein
MIRVAKIVEFYVPVNFPRRAEWVPPRLRGKIIEFAKKSA